jgi:4-hydroxy-2-oxoheptanedioate aldolase
MMTPENSFKAGLRGPAALIGLWLALADPYSAELCATSGFDWLLIDGEHGPNDLRTTLACLQAITGYGPHPVVRVPVGDVTLLKQVLDIGATTILVPMVETAGQARELVRAVRYPPHGVRGVGSGLARSSRWSSYPEYLHEANDRICLLVQLESSAALTAAADIAAVEGIDGVFLGAADLAASMGQLGNPGHPEVQKAIATALTIIHAAGTPSGMLATDEALARAAIENGVRFVAVGVEATLLARAARELAARFKETPFPAGEGY